MPDPNNPPSEVKAYLCFENFDLPAARMIRDWPVTNDDLERYAARQDVEINTPQARTIKDVLSAQVELASVFLCLIGPLSAENEWIRWEIETAKSCSSGLTLVGVYLEKRYPWPEPLQNSGAVFTPMNRDKIQRAVMWAMELASTEGNFELPDAAW